MSREITGALKQQIDAVWNVFWTGGISNPMDVIEQMTYLLFLKRLDEIETAAEGKARHSRAKDGVVPLTFKTAEKGVGGQLCRWQRFRNLPPQQMYDVVSQQAFPFMKSLGGSGTEGGNFDKLGRGAVWDDQIADCIHLNHVFRVRPTTTLMLPHYFEAFLLSRAARAYFLRCAKKTTNLASINMSQLRALPVALPSVDLQRRFSEVVLRVKSANEEQERALGQTERLFGSLQSRAFSGRLE